MTFEAFESLATLDPLDPLDPNVDNFVALRALMCTVRVVLVVNGVIRDCLSDLVDPHRAVLCK